MAQDLRLKSSDASSQKVYARLLIVEDDIGLLNTLRILFTKHGYEVETVATGAEALLKARIKVFDVALIDYLLPDVSGSEILQTVRGLCPGISCILMTAHPSVENLLMVLNLRECGVVLKPLDVPSLLVKVRELVERRRLEVENQNLLEALQAAYLRLEESYNREHRIAEMLQRALLTILPSRIGPFEVGDFYQVSHHESQIGGDIYAVSDHGDGRFSILIADVSGKGLQAAVEMGMVYYSARALSLAFSDPSDVIQHLNRVMCSHDDPTSFVTLFYAVFDTASSRLRYVNAGHEPPLLVNPGNDDLAELTTGGPMVGVSALADFRFEVGECELLPGDTLVLFTDGLSELRSGDEFLERERLHQWLTEAAALPASQGAATLGQYARHFAGEYIRDDLAILLLKYIPQMESALL